MPFTELVRELLEFIDDVVDELGSREEINYIFRMLENGTGADRQLKVFEESGQNYEKLVDYIVDETNLGLTYTPSKIIAETKNDENPDVNIISILTSETIKSQENKDKMIISDKTKTGIKPKKTITVEKIASKKTTNTKKKITPSIKKTKSIKQKNTNRK